MPLYDYACTACGDVTEVRHGFNDKYDGRCAKCGADLRRVFNPAPIVFKGSGFYKTDSRKAAPSESKPGKTQTPSATSETASEKSETPSEKSAPATPSPNSTESAA